MGFVFRDDKMNEILTPFLVTLPLLESLLYTD